MYTQEYPSKLLERAVGEVSRLPGIGGKTALRLMLHLLRLTQEEALRLAEALRQLVQGVQYCEQCHNISDEPLCDICANTARDHTIVCVVENVQDVMAIEKTQLYRGVYHVLGGVISPMDGIKPSDLQLDSLVERVHAGGVQELILALNPTMEGDTTNFYISRRLADMDVRLTVLARGVSIGDEIEYADEVTLGRSLLNRVPLDSQRA
ncbi:MAG: recombination mediator RecR [Bacteroidales bacterium]|nr:recombination mediator RecR [Bacteroidales bacterium]